MTRRARMDFHRRIASCMQATPPAPEPEILAHHLAGAGDVLVAARAWNTAGQAALAAFALTEAVNHVRRGLDCLKSATGPEAAAAETELRTTLGVPLMLREGFASAAAGENYRRLLEVCEQAGSAAEHAMLPALYGMWTFHEVGGRLQQAQQMGRRLLDLGERLSDTGVLLAGHIAHGAARLLRGDIPAARRHLETGLALHDPPVHAGLARLFGQDGAAMCAGFLTWVAAHQDDPEAGRHRAAQALAIARTSLDPGTAGFVEAVVATYHCLTGDHLQAETHALAVIALGEEQGMPHWSAQGRCNLGWALAGQGALQTGAKHLRAGLDGLRATGTRAATSYFQAALVQTELRLGNPDEATRLLAAAHVLVADTDERFNEPELLRLHGEITLARGGPQARALADEAFTQAVQLARLQGSAASARRAAAHLARGATP
jgi:tetratricopeptide (TPR) repeat protein